MNRFTATTFRVAVPLASLPVLLLAGCDAPPTAQPPAAQSAAAPTPQTPPSSPASPPDTASPSGSGSSDEAVPGGTGSADDEIPPQAKALAAQLPRDAETTAYGPWQQPRVSTTWAGQEREADVRVTVLCHDATRVTLTVTVGDTAPTSTKIECGGADTTFVTAPSGAAVDVALEGTPGPDAAYAVAFTVTPR